MPTTKECVWKGIIFQKLHYGISIERLIVILEDVPNGEYTKVIYSFIVRH